MYFKSITIVSACFILISINLIPAPRHLENPKVVLK